ncbi:hypothetical protein ACLB1O_21965 [Escherichia coli]
MSTPSARTGGSLDAWFKISQRGSTVRQEVVAGLTTFLAMVYSVIVVPGMLGKQASWLCSFRCNLSGCRTRFYRDGCGLICRWRLVAPSP